MKKESPQDPCKKKRNEVNVEVPVQNPSPSGKPSVKNHEVGGPPGLEPTRYGDWERKGRCIDF